jgi:hypothetical protein
VNLQIQDSVIPGNNVPVRIQIGTGQSQPNVTIAVK